MITPIDDVHPAWDETMRSILAHDAAWFASTFWEVWSGYPYPPPREPRWNERMRARLATLAEALAAEWSSTWIPMVAQEAPR
jgi:hypothetical protein